MYSLFTRLMGMSIIILVILTLSVLLLLEAMFPGFKIRQLETSRDGGVEAAELEAEGSIEISAGIVGQNKALIKAGKNVKSSFIQDATIEVSGELNVSQSIMHLTVRAGKVSIVLGQKA